MKRLNIKFLVGILAFIIGVFVAGLFTYRILITDNSNREVNKIVELKQSEQAEVSEEEKVYLAILNELFVKDSQRSLSISDKTDSWNLEHLKETTTEERIQHLKKYYESASSETLKDYEMKMHKSSRFNYNFQLPVKYDFINKEELNKDFENDIKDFSKKYPNLGGLIEFSAIGFNENKNQAFVQVDYTFCPLCGFGSSLLLERIDGNWKIVKSYGGWVS